MAACFPFPTYLLKGRQWRNQAVMVIDDEKKKLFKQIRTRLGAPVRKVELEDDALCDLLEQAVGDYAEKVQNFIIESNWANVYGKNATNTDIAFALSVRTLDLAKDYSQWFSKQVGLQQTGKWELKKDFFKIEEGRQVYVVPAGREINKVLWVTPPATDAALWANFAGFGVGFGAGVTGQMGLGSAAVFGGMNSAYGMGVGMYAIPFYDVALMASDLQYKNRFIRSDLTYKVTAGPDGTHLIHLMSTPGSRITFGAGGQGYLGLNNCYVWYTYYDTTADNVDECRKANPDVILTPDQIPLDEMDYVLLNSPTKVIVRQIMFGMACETLALIRGKFSGNLNFIASPVQMDYNMLMTLGQRERDNAMTALKERLERMSPYNMVKKQGELVDDMIRAKKGIPTGMFVI